MRRLLALLVLLPFTARAQVRDSTIAASANKSARVMPDRASMFVIVDGVAETTADALARVDIKVRSVTEALRGLGSRAEVDRPMSFTVSLAPGEQGYPMARTTPSYIARSVIRVQTVRPDQIGNIASTAIGAGASTISGLSFESSVADSVKRARVSEAIATARADAEAIASSLGGRLGALIDVSSSGNFGYQGPSQLSFDTRFGSSQAPAPEINIMVNVTVRYRLIR